MKAIKIVGFFARIALLAIALLVGFSSPSIANGPPPEVLAHVMAVQEKHTPALMARNDVVGTAVGVNGGASPVIYLFTKNERADGAPTSLEGYPVVRIRTGEISAIKGPPQGKGGNKTTQSPRSRFDRPVPIGVSVGNVELFVSDGLEYCSVGTLGVRLSGSDGKKYILSNNHVLAHGNDANIGDNVVQPGTVDLPFPCSDNSATDTIGYLDSFIPIQYVSGVSIPVNRVDGALAFVPEGNVGISTPSDGYGTPESTPVAAVVNAKVQKYGRTTGNTKAIVWGLNATVDVNYGLDALGNQRIARFVGQTVLKGEGFSISGDSGSLIVQESGKGRNKIFSPIGLLFAGSEFYGLTWANPIDIVLDELGGATGVDYSIDGR